MKVAPMFWILAVYETLTLSVPELYTAVVVEAGMLEETNAVKLNPSTNCSGGSSVKTNDTELL
jgi:hypothetical protein